MKKTIAFRMDYEYYKNILIEYTTVCYDLCGLIAEFAHDIMLLRPYTYTLREINFDRVIFVTREDKDHLLFCQYKELKRINIRTLETEDILTVNERLAVNPEIAGGAWYIDWRKQDGTNLYLSICDELHVYNMVNGECSRIYTGDYEKTGNTIYKIEITENNVIIKMWHFPRKQQQLIVIDKQTYKPNKVLEVDNGEFLFSKSYIIKVIREEIPVKMKDTGYPIAGENNSNIKYIEIYDKKDISCLGTIDIEDKTDIGGEPNLRIIIEKDHDFLILESDNKIQILDLNKGSRIREIPVEHECRFSTIIGDKLICCNRHVITKKTKGFSSLIFVKNIDKMLIYDLKTGAYLFKFDNIYIDDEFGQLRKIDDQYLLIEDTDNGEIKLVDIEKRKVVREFSEHMPHGYSGYESSYWYIDNELFVSIANEGRQLVIREFDVEDKPQVSGLAEGQEKKEKRIGRKYDD